MKKSFWDNSIFKKYSSVSHNRLLSQLLSELKAYPINRQDKAESIKKKPNKINQDNTIESSHVQNISIDNVSKNNNLYSNIDSIKVKKKSKSTPEETTSLTFKEKLRNIDMK